MKPFKDFSKFLTLIESQICFFSHHLVRFYLTYNLELFVHTCLLILLVI